MQLFPSGTSTLTDTECVFDEFFQLVWRTRGVRIFLDICRANGQLHSTHSRIVVLLRCLPSDQEIAIGSLTDINDLLGELATRKLCDTGTLFHISSEMLSIYLHMNPEMKRDRENF